MVLSIAGRRAAGVRDQGTGVMRVVSVVPPVPALLPEYSGSSDAVPDLRKAVLEAVAWLAEHSPARVVVLGDGPDPANVARGVSASLARRIAASLLDQTGFSGELVQTWDGSDAAVLVLANGSARRGEKAPGHLDSRAFGHDTVIERALTDGDRETFAASTPTSVQTSWRRVSTV